MKPAQLGQLAEVRRLAKSGEAKRIRIHADVTQAEMAACSGVTQPTVCLWEAGKRTPSGAAALRYAAALRELARRSPTAVGGGQRAC